MWREGGGAISHVEGGGGGDKWSHHLTCRYPGVVGLAACRLVGACTHLQEGVIAHHNNISPTIWCNLSTGHREVSLMNVINGLFSTCSACRASHS